MVHVDPGSTRVIIIPRARYFDFGVPINLGEGISGFIIIIVNIVHHSRDLRDSCLRDFYEASVFLLDIPRLNDPAIVGREAREDNAISPRDTSFPT